MSLAVSIVVPALGMSAHLAGALRALERALLARGGHDEVLVVDDSGSGALAAELCERFGRVRVLAQAENGGFARALQRGIQEARHGLVFCMNSDLQPQRGFLEPLIVALADKQVFAATPLVLRAQDGPQRIESLTRVEFERGRARILQPLLDPAAAAASGELCSVQRPVPFTLGGACLLRRADYLELGGLDGLFEPFYLEDVDLCWRAWRAGLRCVHVPTSRVLHTNQATIAAVAPRALVQAAIAKNQWLFEWKHLDGRELEAHLEALEEFALEAWLNEDRTALEVLALALEQLDGALAGRSAPVAGRTFAELARHSDPLRA